MPVLLNPNSYNVIQAKREEGVDFYLRPLRLADRYLCHIAYGRIDLAASLEQAVPQVSEPERVGARQGHVIQLETVQPSRSFEEIEVAALEGLRSAGLQWEPFFLDDGDGDVLICSHQVGAPGVLDADFIRAAQRRLGCGRVILGLPAVDTLFIASGDAPEGVHTFALIVAATFKESLEWLSPLAFYASDGLVDGIYEGSAAVLEANDIAPEDFDAVDWPGEDPTLTWQSIEAGVASAAQGALLKALQYGEFLSDRHDYEGAQRAFRLVVASGEETYITEGLSGLAGAYWLAGDLPAAADAFKRTVEFGGQLMPSAACCLGIVLVELGDLSAAQGAFERAIATGHADVTPIAEQHLRELRARLGPSEPAQSSTPAAIRAQESAAEPDDEADDRPVLPVLQPLAWAESLGANTGEGGWPVEAMARPLVLAGQHVGYIAFARDTSDDIRLSTPTSLRSDGADPDDYQAAALMNLRLLKLEWRPLEIEPPTGEPFVVLACDGHRLAAAAILDRSFLAQAQLILGCDRILVAIPNRDLLQVGRAGLPDQQLGHFAGSVEAFHDSNDDPISPLTFYATNGVVDGICDPPPVE